MAALLVLAWDLEEKKIILQKQRCYIHLQQPPKDKRLSWCFARLQSLKWEGCSSISAKTSVRWQHYNFAADWGSAVVLVGTRTVSASFLYDAIFSPQDMKSQKNFTPNECLVLFLSVFSLRDFKAIKNKDNLLDQFSQYHLFFPP